MAKTKMEKNENLAIVKVSNFSKRFSHKKLIGPISFEIMPNKFHALIGSSGSGKTVLIKSLVKGIKRYKGKIKFFNKKFSWVKIKNRLGYVPEFLSFPNNTSAYNFIYSLGKLYGLQNKYLKNKIVELMKLFDIWDNRDKDINSFSSGMKKRVMIIQGILHDPDLIILDEPDSGLDSDNRLLLFSYLKKLTLSGKTILICTHMVNEIIPFMDSFTLINQGKQIYSGSSDFLKNRFKFHIVVDQTKTLLDYLTEKKYEYSMISKDDITLFTNNFYAFMDIYQFCKKKEIKIIYLKQLELTLTEIEELSSSIKSLENIGINVENNTHITNIENIKDIEKIENIDHIEKINNLNHEIKKEQSPPLKPIKIIEATEKEKDPEETLLRLKVNTIINSINNLNEIIKVLEIKDPIKSKINHNNSENTNDDF